MKQSSFPSKSPEPTQQANAIPQEPKQMPIQTLVKALLASRPESVALGLALQAIPELALSQREASMIARQLVATVPGYGLIRPQPGCILAIHDPKKLYTREALVNMLSQSGIQGVGVVLIQQPNVDDMDIAVLPEDEMKAAGWVRLPEPTTGHPPEQTTAESSDK